MRASSSIKPLHPPSWKLALRPFLIIALVEWLSFSPFLPQLGFYHDDWPTLERAWLPGGLWNAIKYHAGIPAFAIRPVQILLFPLLFSIGGFNPVIYQTLFLIMETIGGWLLFLFLERWLKHRELALWATLFFLILPIHSVTHHWLAISSLTLSMDFLLASLLLYMHWIETGRRRWRWISLTCYALSVLCYEALALLPLILGAGLVVRRTQAGLSPKSALTQSAKELIPFGLALGAALLWARYAVAILFDSPNPRPIGISPLHFLQSYAFAFYWLTYRLFKLCAYSTAAAFSQFKPAWLLAAAGFSLGLVAILEKLKKQKSDSNRDKLPVQMVLAGAGIGLIAAYAPYALSRDYIPSILGVMSRTSAGAALPLGLALACGILWLNIPWLRRCLLAASLGVFTLTNWNLSRQWARSWDIQQSILWKFSSHLSELPAQATVLLDIPRYVDHTLSGALIFDANYDFSAALRLVSGRQGLGINVLSPRLRFAKEGLIESTGSQVIGEKDYSRLYLYRYAEDSLLAFVPLEKPSGSLPFKLRKVCHLPHAPASIPQKFRGPSRSLPSWPVLSKFARLTK